MSFNKAWYDIHCGECGDLIAFTQSGQPLPLLLCPQCQEIEIEEQAKKNASN